MKKFFFLKIVGIFLLGLLFLPRISNVFAQTGGTCNCMVGESRNCGMTTNKCASGYLPTCATITSCNGTASSCTCTPEGNCAKNTVPTIGQRCCSGYTPEPRSGVCLLNGYDPAHPTSIPVKTCDLIKDNATRYGACKICMESSNPGVWTAIGCIKTTPEGLIKTFLPFAISIAGGIAFLLILFGALQMMMSAGNPEKLNAGKELVTAAITGLLFIIFSLFLLQLIGYKILQIPGFG